MDDERKSVRINPLNHKRLIEMKAQAIVKGYDVRSLDDAVDLLLQLWNRAEGKGLLLKLAPPPKRR
jgi:hypothetical protein